jgi:predicted anti-sigma-YlaC factor YlaD
MKLRLSGAMALTDNRGMRRRQRVAVVIGLLVCTAVAVGRLASGLLHEGIGWTIALGCPLLLVAAD